MKGRHKRSVFFFAMSFFVMLLSGYPAGAAWNITSADRTGNVGGDTSLALNSGGNPRISYYRFDTGDLRYAWCDTVCATTGNWNSVAVDTVGDVGEDTSLALDGSGNPRISYYRFASGDLKYAWCDAGCSDPLNWNSITVDSSGDVGEDSSLVLDSSGNPRISYYAFETGDLKYAWCDGGCEDDSNWTIVTVDSNGTAGLYTSLALDSSGSPRISYYRSDTGDLQYAWCDTGCDNPLNWSRVTPASAGTVGLYTSLALDSGNNPRISYQNGTGLDLSFTWCDGGCGDPANWNSVTVDSLGTVGADASLALDSSGNPRISYSGNNTLKYAWCDGGCANPVNWTSETVDSSSASVGGYTSLKLNSSDIPHISYYDLTGGNLNYAFVCDGSLDCTEGVDCDNDCDGVYNQNDNCPGDFNPQQEDTYPPQGNGIGDACDCECDFACDGDVDAPDVAAFLDHFGRSIFNNPCSNDSPCNGDNDCDGNVDSYDVEIFLEDFGRSRFFNPCPACVVEPWCSY